VASFKVQDSVFWVELLWRRRRSKRQDEKESLPSATQATWFFGNVD